MTKSDVDKLSSGGGVALTKSLIGAFSIGDAGAACGYCGAALAEREWVRLVLVATVHGDLPADVRLLRCSRCDGDATARPVASALREAISRALLPDEPAEKRREREETRQKKRKGRRGRIVEGAKAGCFRVDGRLVS